MLNERKICNANDAHSWITIWSTECVKLLEIDVLDAGLGRKHSGRSVIERLVEPDEAARERPTAQIGMVRPANEDRPKRIRLNSN